jgi:hypothetical protein
VHWTTGLEGLCAYRDDNREGDLAALLYSQAAYVHRRRGPAAKCIKKGQLDRQDAVMFVRHLLHESRGDQQHQAHNCERSLGIVNPASI